MSRSMAFRLSLARILLARDLRGAWLRDQAAPIARRVRLPVAMCLANTDGSDGRARTNEWGKITHLMPTQQLSPGIAARSAGGIPSPVDPSRINKGMIPTGGRAHPPAVVGRGRGYAIDRLGGKTFKGCATDTPQRWAGRL